MERPHIHVSDHPNIDDLKDRVLKLYILLDSPYPGLITWRLAYAAAAKNVLEFFNDEPTNTQKGSNEQNHR